MKKIGILTFHRPINYGAFLQCFSLVQQLKKTFEDIEIEVIDYIAPKEKYKIYKNVVRELVRNGPKQMYLEIIKIYVFKKSLKKLPLSTFKTSTSNLDILFKYMNSNYDLIIVGSDAIFNWNQNGFPSAFFLNYDFKIPIISYAASVHGMNFYEIDSNEREYCNRALSRFSFVGVRDQNTENFVKYCNNSIVPMHTCDPTFFYERKNNIDIGILDDILMKKYSFNINQKYIVIMLQNEHIESEIYKRYKLEYKIVTLFKNSKYSDYFLYDLNPFEWSSVIANSKIVFTQYFHGALLSLRNNKPVIVIDASFYTGVYESKLKDLLTKRLNLHYLYFTKEELTNKDKIEEMMNISNKAISGEYSNEISKCMDNEVVYFDIFKTKIESLLDTVK